jgi:hypothetical protein
LWVLLESGISACSSREWYIVGSSLGRLNKRLYNWYLLLLRLVCSIKEI